MVSSTVARNLAAVSLRAVPAARGTVRLVLPCPGESRRQTATTTLTAAVAFQLNHTTTRGAHFSPAPSSKSQSAPRDTAHAARSHAACDKNRTAFPAHARRNRASGNLSTVFTNARACAWFSATALRHAASVGLARIGKLSVPVGWLFFPPDESSPLHPKRLHATTTPKCCEHWHRPRGCRRIDPLSSSSTDGPCHALPSNARRN